MSVYGDKYRVTGYNPNGLCERVRLGQWQWTGAVTDLTGAGEDWLEVEWSVADFGDPLPLSEARLRVVGQFGSVLAEIQGSDDAAYLLTWETEETPGSGAFQTRWWGFLTQQDYADYPFDPVSAVEVRAVDGIALLADKVYDPAASGFGIMWMAQQVAHMLDRAAPDDSAVGIGDGLVTRMEWVPWLPARITAANALAQLILPLGIFADESGDTRSMCLAVLRQVVGRFGMRLFQSRGRWLAVQPHRYRPDASGDVDVFVYGSTSDAAAGASGAATALSVAKDSERWAFAKSEGGPQRGISHRVREAVSVYDFEPDLDQLLRNGGFEDPGDTAAEAQFWTLYTGGERVDINDEADYIPASTGNEYALKVTATTTSGVVAATQSGQYTIPGNTAAVSLRVDVTAGFAVTAGVTSPRIRVRCGDYYLAERFLIIASRALKGKDVRVYVEPILDGVTGVVDGTPVLIKGTPLNIFDTVAGEYRQATVKETARVGDRSVVLDLPENIDPADIDDPSFYVWEEHEGGTPESVLLFQRGPTGEEYLTTFRFDAPFVDPSGAGVGGAFAFSPERQVDVDAEAYYYVTEAKAALVINEQVSSEIAYQAALALGSGISVQLPTRAVGDQEWLLGDGPAPDSLGGLYVRDGASLPQTTLQGANTGWKVGPYAALESSSGRTIDALHALDVMRSRGVTLERWRLPIESTDLDGVPVIIDPEHVARFRQALRLHRHAFLGTDEIETPVRLRVGDEITLLDAEGDAESHTVTDVVGAGPFTATLDGTLAQAYPVHTSVLVQRDLFWDRLTQRPGRGLIVYEGTEQLLDEDVPVTEQTLQQ